MDIKDWQAVLDGLRVVAPGLAALILYQLRQLLAKLAELERAAERLKDWQINHDRMDDLRFATAQHQIDQLKSDKD